jgi:hypothetical protein
LFGCGNPEVPGFPKIISIDKPKIIGLGHRESGRYRIFAQGNIDVVPNVCRRFAVVGDRDEVNCKREQYRVGRVVRPGRDKAIVNVHKVALLWISDLEC